MKKKQEDRADWTGVQDDSQFLAKVTITHIPIDPWGLQTAQWVKQSSVIVGRNGEMVSTSSWKYRKRSQKRRVMAMTVE